MGTDRDDWAAALAGDGRAYARIFRQHGPRIGRHVAGLTDSAADADDVVAITFFEAWRHRDRVRFVDGSLLPWLLATAGNVARNVSRGSRRYGAALARLPVAEPREADHDAREALSAIRALDPRDRDVALLCLVEGYGEREAAEALGIRPGTVKSRLHRARRQLRARLADPGHDGEVIDHGI